MTGRCRASAGLFLLTGSVLVLEVALTRVFSVMTYYHFACIIISLAMLGFGAASTFLTVSPRFAESRLDAGMLARYALIFSLTTVLGFAIATKIRFYPMDAYTYGDTSNVFSLLILYVIVGVPFFFAGVCIGYLISRAGEAINRLYFADLLGAGTGALLSIPGINYLGVESTIYAAAAAGALAAALFALKGGTRRLRIGSVACVVLSLLMVNWAAHGTIFPVYLTPNKVGRQLAMPPHYMRWHAVARVDVIDFGKRSELALGSSVPPRDTKPGAEAGPELWVLQDGWAGTRLVPLPGGDLAGLSFLDDYLHTSPYATRPDPERALVIGVGGGIDVLVALHHGVKQITGVEINPAIVDVVKRQYADFIGRIFDRPDVELIAAEGRHYLTTTDERFDLIQLTGVDTATALSTGAYALAENYLYTIEAMHDYWGHLSDDGILSFLRCLFDPPRETLRLVAAEVEALHQMGIERPEHHILMVTRKESRGQSYAATLLSKRPFTEAEVASCQRWADRSGNRLLYDPYRSQAGPFDAMIRAPVDQRESMIEQYTYNIRPATDDNPFFFQYGRWDALLKPAKMTRSSQGGYPAARFPLALAYLLVTILQILVLAGAFIILPLLPRGSDLRHIKHKGRALAYFAGLGLAFITVEIGLLQKYTVFVGGPVYAMAVTLSAILMFSGLGSLMSRRLRDLTSYALTFVLLALVCAILGEILFVNYAVPRLMYLSHGYRCVVTALALAPLAILMGMPFPMGLRAVQRLGQAIVPWAWGVNAVTTTLGSILCVLASIGVGFSASLFAAAMIYLLGILVAPDDVRAESQICEA